MAKKETKQEKVKKMNDPTKKVRFRFLREIIHRYCKNRLAVAGFIILILFALAAIFADYVAPYWYDDQDISRRLMNPCWEFPCGTDQFGRCVLSRLIYGSRISIEVGFVAVGISLLAGGILGMISAYYNKLDNIIMRIMDLFQAIPNTLLAITIAATLGSGMMNLMIAVGISNVPRYARVVRAEVLRVKESEFIEAATSIGASSWRIMIRHILPNSLSPIIVQVTLGIAGAIISASALSFLGFGLSAPIPEWGAMLSDGRQFIRTQWYLCVFPGLCIMILVYALNIMGDGLRDALDPRLKK